MFGRVFGMRRRAHQRCGAWLLTLFVSGCGEAVAPPNTPAPVAAVELAAPRPTLSVGDSLDMVAILRAANGSALSGRAIQWSTSAPDVATVTSSGRVVAVSNGTTTISARSENQEGRALITVATPAVEIMSLVPALLIAGETAEIRGRGFNTRTGAMSVTLGSTVAVLGPVTETSVVFTVPCVTSGEYALTVRSQGTNPQQRASTVQRRELSLAVGEFQVLATMRQAGCTLLPVAVGPSEYLVTVFNTATTPSASAAFEWVGVRSPPVSALAHALFGTALPTLGPRDAAVNRDAGHAAVHEAHLVRERQQQGSVLPVQPVRSKVQRPAAVPVVLNAQRRFYFTFGSTCADTSRVMAAQAMAVGRHVAIWEDTTNTVRATPGSELAAWYARLLRIADDEQLPLVQRTVGDPLLRDASTDADGLVHLVFSQRVNATGTGAYVTSCDLRQRTLAAGSNNGEVMYGVAPTTTVSNPESAESPDGWFSFMSRTVVHELKHMASYATRTARQVPFEEVWLEEGTARMAEEVWARAYLYRQMPRSNTGFGSPADGGVYCDFHPANASCNAGDLLRRPSYGMRRHFNDLRNKLVQPWNWSPFGDAPGQSGAVYYNSAWSLLRHAADHCCSSDSAFLTALNNSSRVGMDNLSQVSGRTGESLLGAWGMALLADDRVDLPGMSALTQFLSWDFRSIYAGLHNAPAWQSRWTTPYPVLAMPLTADSLGAALHTGPSIRGGGHAFYELRVAPGSTSLLQLRGPSNTPLSETLRVGIVRIR
jgi:hypothetical protein